MNVSPPPLDPDAVFRIFLDMYFEKPTNLYISLATGSDYNEDITKNFDIFYLYLYKAKVLKPQYRSDTTLTC